jgi:hypothetical protein
VRRRSETRRRSELRRGTGEKNRLMVKIFVGKGKERMKRGKSILL